MQFHCAAVSLGQKGELSHVPHSHATKQKFVAVELAKPLETKGLRNFNGLWLVWRPVGDSNPCYQRERLVS